MAKDTLRDDTHSDYRQVKSEAMKAMRRGVWTDRFEERFVSFAGRELRCDLPREAFRILSEGKHFISYRGIPMAKDPLDIVLYEMLFYEIQPRTVIELGAYTGASALWMADTLRSLEIKAKVISVDIDLSLVDSQAKEHPGLRFIQGDCNAIESVFPAEQLADMPHPMVLIDDAHVNISGVYGHFHRHGLVAGDYLVVEDTAPWIPGTFGTTDDDREWGQWKWEQIQGFFQQHQQSYRVDRYYTDFFGYNGTWNWNGFLKRVD